MGPKYTVDEQQPRQTEGSYVARALHGIPGVAFYPWLVLQAAMLMSIRTTLWVPEAPISPMYLCIPTLCLGLLGIVANIFYFGPQSKKSPASFNTSDMPRPVSPLGKADRLARAGNDQWLLTAVTGATTFVLLFMVIFYDRYGEFPFRPLVASPSNTQIVQRGIVASFIDMLIGIAGMATFVVLCTLGDTIKRLWSGSDDLAMDTGSYEMLGVSGESSAGQLQVGAHQHMGHATNNF